MQINKKKLKSCVYLVLLAATALSVVALFFVVRDQVSGVYNLE